MLNTIRRTVPMRQFRLGLLSAGVLLAAAVLGYRPSPIWDLSSPTPFVRTIRSSWPEEKRRAYAFAFQSIAFTYTQDGQDE